MRVSEVSVHGYCQNALSVSEDCLPVWPMSIFILSYVWKLSPSKIKFSVFSECLLIVITSVVSFLMMTYCCISHKWSQIMWSDAARECKYLKRYEVICITDKEQFCVHKGKYCRPELQQIKNTIAEAVRIHLPMKGNSQQVHLSRALLIACMVFF